MLPLTPRVYFAVSSSDGESEKRDDRLNLVKISGLRLER